MSNLEANLLGVVESADSKNRKLRKCTTKGIIAGSEFGTEGTSSMVEEDDSTQRSVGISLLRSVSDVLIQVVSRCEQSFQGTTVAAIVFVYRTGKAKFSRRSVTPW